MFNNKPAPKNNNDNIQKLWQEVTKPKNETTVKLTAKEIRRAKQIWEGKA